MTPERWRRITEIFHAARERGATAEALLLDEACAGDRTLRSEVEALLGADREAAASGEPSLAGMLGPEDTGATLAATSEAPTTTPAQVGAAFGPYRVTGTLGEGGMGVVYLAERDDGQFLRTVAIKRVGMAVARADVLRRFRDERRILAQLQHPNIASLLDAGVDAAGLPYLVMEHVDGLPITSFCREQRVGVRRRLELFTRVCEAVQHAHRNLVIHRDIKPGNILVSPGGEPKLLDFGIAKVVGEGAVDSTRTVNRAFTLGYASPEQVRGDAVTTASDVYSLGVLLYELLADAAPFDLSSCSLAEGVRQVCEVVPSPPSRVAPLDRRGELAGDLDSIASKAMQKVPGDRYGSVAEFAADVEAHLAHRPVRARRLSMGYLFRKFARRHLAGVAAAAALLALVATGVAAVLWQARRAERQRAVAQRRFEQVRHLANAVVFELHDAIRFLPGATAARHLLVVRGLEYLDSLAGEAHDDVGLSRELAAAYRRLGDAQGDPVGASLGDPEGALRTYQKALALQRSVLAGEGDVRDRFAIAELQFQIAAVHRVRGDLREAERAYHATAEQVEAVLSSGPARSEYRGSLTAAYQRLGEVLSAQGRKAEANEALQKAIAVGEIQSRDWPDDWKVRLNLSVAYSADANRLAQEGRYVEALSRVRSGRAIQEALLAAQPLQSQFTRALLFTLNSEGRYLAALARTREAVQTYEGALDVARAVSERDPKDRFGQLALAVAAESLGAALVTAGCVPEGIQRLEEARRTAAGVLREDPGSTYAAERLASTEKEIRAAHDALRVSRVRCPGR